MGRVATIGDGDGKGREREKRMGEKNRTLMASVVFFFFSDGVPYMIQ